MYKDQFEACYVRVPLFCECVCVCSSVWVWLETIKQPIQLHCEIVLSTLVTAVAQNASKKKKAWVSR